MRLLEATSRAELTGNDLGDALARDGLVFIHEGGVEEIRALLATWTCPVRHPHEREVGLTIITPRSDLEEDEGLAGFTQARLSPHTDRSLEPDPPSLLATVMIYPAADSGFALLLDGAHVLATLHRSFGQSAVDSLYLIEADGTTTRVIETFGSLVKIRFRADRVAQPHSTTGNQEVLDALHELVSRPTAIRLGSGDGYLVHNHRYLHGRSSFTGTRRLVRMLAKVRVGHHLSWLNQGFRVANL